jgi:hypothetical protein
VIGDLRSKEANIVAMREREGARGAMSNTYFQKPNHNIQSDWELKKS